MVLTLALIALLAGAWWLLACLADQPVPAVPSPPEPPAEWVRGLYDDLR